MEVVVVAEVSSVLREGCGNVRYRHRRSRVGVVVKGDVVRSGSSRSRGSCVLREGCGNIISHRSWSRSRGGGSICSK